MSELDIAIRYTDEEYLTYSQVSKALRIFTIDDYWRSIDNYRQKYRVDLPFKAIKGVNFFITLTDPIKAKIELFDKKIQDFMVLLRNAFLKYPRETRNLIFGYEIKELSNLEKCNISDLSVKALTGGYYEGSSSSDVPAASYLQVLDYYLDKTPDSPDDEFLGNALARVLGQEELVSFYRESDFDASVRRMAYVLNPDYPYCPYEAIDEEMSPLLEWLRDDSACPFFVHSLASSFFLDYIRPFLERNASMATLLAKCSYASETRDSFAFALPFEAILSEEIKKSEEYHETKARKDLTYLVFKAIDVLSPIIDRLINELKKNMLEPLKKEFVTLSEDEEKAIKGQDESTSPTQLNLDLSSSKAESEESKPLEERPLEDDVKQEPLRNDDVPKITPPPQERVDPSEVLSELSEDNLRKAESEESLSKSEMKDYVRYLLETNPNLNKKQASFLASHCTEGRYYTIQQFKDFTKCVYETARTSMDRLASEGYYKKIQFKNKFVYTPIMKGK